MPGTSPMRTRSIRRCSLDRALRYTAALRGAGGRRRRGGRGAARGRPGRALGLPASGSWTRASASAPPSRPSCWPSPSQLFLEEPTIGLDPAQGTEVMRRLRRLCESGTHGGAHHAEPARRGPLRQGGRSRHRRPPGVLRHAGRRLRLLRGRQPGRDLRAAGWSRRPGGGLVPPLPPVLPNGPWFHRLPDRSAATGAGPPAARHRGPALGRPRVDRPARGPARRRARRGRPGR